MYQNRRSDCIFGKKISFSFFTVTVAIMIEDYMTYLM